MVGKQHRSDRGPNQRLQAPYATDLICGPVRVAPDERTMTARSAALANLQTLVSARTGRQVQWAALLSMLCRVSFLLVIDTRVDNGQRNIGRTEQSKSNLARLRFRLAVIVTNCLSHTENRRTG